MPLPAWERHGPVPSCPASASAEDPERDARLPPRATAQVLEHESAMESASERP